MKKQKISAIHKILFVAGIGLLIAAVILLFFWQYGIRFSDEKAEAYVHTIRTLIPELQGAVPEERSNNIMPILSLAGTDFVGILEIPRYNSSLPVCEDWSQRFRYPCHFSGSIYDRTMQIGGTSQKGQYDFYREISVGDAVFFTDMEGNRYTYTVTDICYEKRADQSALRREDSALTLFIKNIYAFEYIIIFCTIAS